MLAVDKQQIFCYTLTITPSHVRQNGALMKTAIKVFLIISYIGAGFSTLDAISFLSQGNRAVGIFMLINAAIVVAVAIIAQRKLATATCRADLRGIGIITLLFSNLIAGILMLCISDYELTPNTQQYNPYSNPYGNPYGSPYGSPYNDPYGSPYSGQQQNPNAQQQYQSPFGSPYGNPTGTPFNAPQDETPKENEQPTEENKDDTPTDQE